jgi:hypothetical protein
MAEGGGGVGRALVILAGLRDEALADTAQLDALENEIFDAALNA